ncbi:MAG: hypothetical protein K0R65_467 [Crocinitomicaceae bacterium]|jgi:hypothetical protein|nr:hypothetical protein [Crocinitomicaceae bacterium]
MKEVTTDFQTTSKNAFEKFYQLIEKLRLQSGDIQYTESLNFLENTILLQERMTQDLNDLIKDKNDLEVINNLINEFLNEFADIILLNYYNESSSMIDSISYNILTACSLLTQISDIDNFIRHFTKLFISRRLNKIVKLHTLIVNSNHKYIISRQQAHNIYSNIEYSKEIKREFENLFINRLVTDYFNLGNFNSFKNLNVSELNQYIKRVKSTNKIEKLFELKENEYYVWDIDIKFNNSYYSAKNISYLIFSLTSSIESLGEIKVEINDWGKGSLWINLSVKINDAISKIDLILLLKKIRQGIESIIHKKTYSEIKKIDLETEKLEKELHGIPNLSQSNEIIQLEIKSKKLDLEIKKEDLIKKRIENIAQLSGLIQDGLLQNDGDLQVLINSSLYLAFTDGIYDSNNNKSLSEIEGKESIESDNVDE